jgi:dimeric dUTPase (all-alpha-NTP-PPase superfamily)
VLDTKIEEEHGLQETDLFENKILASLVELAECANEWRGFKHWSKNQEPTTVKATWPYGAGGPPVYKNPLLEEYVDKLHFLLSLGLEMGYDQELKQIPVEKREDITKQFLHLFYLTSTFMWFNSLKQYEMILGHFVGLGEMLGFSWDEVETAYFEKNKENHERQENGY